MNCRLCGEKIMRDEDFAGYCEPCFQVAMIEDLPADALCPVCETRPAEPHLDGLCAVCWFETEAER